MEEYLFCFIVYPPISHSLSCYLSSVVFFRFFAIATSLYL